MPRPGSDSVVLVTGFPSFYAKYLIWHILTNAPKTTIFAIVLDKLRASAEELCATLPIETRDRLILIEGDAAAIDMGLSGSEYRQLTREVDLIHHAAHIRYAGASKKLLDTLHIVATAEILEFARMCTSLRLLAFHSTAHVSGNRRGVVYESELDVGQTFRNDIESTRMRAEKLVRQSIHDLPICVLRPTNIVGDSTTGEIDRFDGLYLLILFMIAMPTEFTIPLHGKGDTFLNLVPIDYVVRVAHAIASEVSSVGRTFHIADPHPLTAKSVFDLIAKSIGKKTIPGFIPSNIAKMLLKTPGIERFVRSPRTLIEHLTTDVRYDTQNTDGIVLKNHIECPRFESYVDAVISEAQNQLRNRKDQTPIAPVHVDETEIEDPLL